MKPIALMRLRYLEVPSDILRKYKPADLYIEQKFDGHKVMASRDKSGTKLYSRNGKDISAKAPGVVNRLNTILPHGTTLLGEMIYVAKGQQSLGLVQSILHSKGPKAVLKTSGHGGRLEFVVYDVIEYNGKDISVKPLSYRRSILNNIIIDSTIIRKSKIYDWSQHEKAMDDAIRSGGEGIVIKVKSSPYTYRVAGASEPFGEWWKHKVPGEKSNTEDVILFGYEKREKRLAFKMYQIDSSGKRAFVGFISNLPISTESDVKKLSDSGKSVVAEISHQQRFPSGKFRHPGWIRLRPDKPIKSATFSKKERGKIAKKESMKSRNPSDKDYNIYVVRESGNKLFLYTFNSKELIHPTISAMQYEFILRGAPAKGNTHVLNSDASLREYLKKNLHKNIFKGKFVQQNPRNSKVKDALNDEATRYEVFSDFASAYWNTCSRGLYWYATDEKKFHIGEHERRLINEDKFRVYCSPALALKGVNADKKYVAELNVTKVPSKSIILDKKSDGESVKIISAPGSIQVSRVLDAAKALRAFAWQASLLPSSKEELRDVWESAWKKRKRVAKITEARGRAEAEREEHRAKIRTAKESASRTRARKKAEREAAGKKRLQERRKKAAAKSARERAEAVEKAVRKAGAAKAGSGRPRGRAPSKRGTKRVIHKVGEQINPSHAVRMVPSRVNNPGS